MEASQAVAAHFECDLVRPWRTRSSLEDGTGCRYLYVYAHAMGPTQSSASVGRMIGKDSVSAALDIPVSVALDVLRSIDRVLSQGAVENARDAMREAARRRVALSVLIERTAVNEHEQAEVTELRERVSL